MNIHLRYIFSAILLALPVIASAQRYDGVVDKTIAVVGNEKITLSQLEVNIVRARQAGMNLTRCQMLEEMLERKLFILKAKADSVMPDINQIEVELNNMLQGEITKFGSLEAVEANYGKPAYLIKETWRPEIEELMLVQTMKRQVAQNVNKLTPTEVEAFYENTPEDSLPVISTKYRLRQIMLYPQSHEAAVRKVRERLLEFRNRIINGEKFSVLATLYSEDGSASRGGELGMAPKSYYVTEFSDAAMALNPGQVSPIVETPYGFHIIQMIKKSEEVFNVRHILLKPKYEEGDMLKAFSELDSIASEVRKGNIAFQDAAVKFSEDNVTRVNGGLLPNPYDGSSYYQKDQLRPDDFRAIQFLKEGEVSAPYVSTDDTSGNPNGGNTVYKIIYLEKVIPSHVATLSGDYNELLDAANYRESQKAIDRFLDESIEKTYIKIDPMFRDCSFRRKGWVRD